MIQKVKKQGQIHGVLRPKSRTPAPFFEIHSKNGEERKRSCIQMPAYAPSSCRTKIPEVGKGCCRFQPWPLSYSFSAYNNPQRAEKEAFIPASFAGWSMAKDYV
jgi:hypothetical protein